MSVTEKQKSHRRTASANDACSSSGSNNDKPALNSDISHDQMIGYHYNPKSKYFVHGLSSTWSGKAPKVPQPDQTLHAFTVVMNALREIIQLVKTDYTSLKLAADNSSISSHQMKAAERYCRKLEFHLFKLEELQERYQVQQKMREGIRSMAYAYILSHGKGRDSALHNVHSGYKECNDLLCSYESKLQLMMGSFIFEMIGIQGFARMCNGDIFEIIIKHGDQKWKSRGQVLKNDKQSWESKRVLFKSFFTEPLYIKAIEVRGLGKNIVLGNKYCETKDLFSAHPQQMTINLNPSGSLKLKLIIIWNPMSKINEEVNTLQSRPTLFGSLSLLDCDLETSSSIKNINPFISASETYSKGPMEHSVDYENKLFKYTHKLSPHTSFQSSIKTFHQEPSSEIHMDDLPCSHPSNITPESLLLQMPMYISKSFLQNKNFQDSQLWSSEQSANSSECNSIEMASSSEFSSSSSNKLQEVLSNFLSSLENVCEQYPDLATLYDKAVEIEKLLKFQRQSLLGSDVSISIKNALGCFDFLNTAVDGDECDSMSERDLDDKTVKSHCTEKNSDFAEYNENSISSLDPSPLPLTSGVEQLDTAIIIHSDYSLKLTEKLCSGTPLKCFEVLSLNKLQKQIHCFSSLLKSIRGIEKIEKKISCCDFFSEEENALKQLWIQLVNVDSITSVVDQLLPALEKFLQPILFNGKQSIHTKVASRVVSKMLDKVIFTPETPLTVGQFHLFFIQYDSLESSVQKITFEVSLLEELRSKQLLRIKPALHLLKTSLPFNDALFEVCYFLLTEDVEIKTLGECFLKDVAKNASLKCQVETAYLEGIESEESKLRQGSCAALYLLEACDCSEQIAYLSEYDQNVFVRKEAAKALLSFSNMEMKL